MDYKTLISHHLSFLSTHRGIHRQTTDADIISSDKAAFNIIFPYSEKAAAEASPEYFVYLPDLIALTSSSVPHRIKAGSLTYMIFEGDENNWNQNDQIRAYPAETEQCITDFSQVQGRGFCETEEVFREWHPWMHEKNLNNLHNPDQTFYTGYDGEVPVGVALAVYHQNIMGLYAVATLPGHRKQGISSAVMKKAISDARAKNINTITLQVMTDSYAHSFYQQLGFKDVFHCSILKHDPSAH